MRPETDSGQRDCPATHRRLTDAASVAACLADTAAACIVLADGSMPPVVHLRVPLSAQSLNLEGIDPPDITPVGGALLEIADTQADVRVKAHPWVALEPHFRFIAAVPLVGPGNRGIGTLFLLDTRCRRLSEEVCRAVQAFARQTGTALTAHPGADADALRPSPGKAEQTLRQLIRNAPVALAMFDREMRYLEASNAWSEAFGMGGTSEIGQSHYTLFPDVPERYRNSHQRSMQGEVFRVDEDHWVNRDGTSGWYRWEQRPWYDVDGSIGGIILFAEDITDIRISAAVLRMLSVEGTGLHLPSFLQMCAIRLADILELDRVHIAQPCPDEPGWMQTLALCADGAEAANVRYALDGTPCKATLEQGTCFYPTGVQARFPEDRALGEMGYESYVGLSLRNREGQVLGLLAGTSRRSLTNAEQVLNALRMAAIGIGAALERHHAAAAINENMRFNHSLLNALTSQVAVLDATGRIIFTNRAWEERRLRNVCLAGRGSVGTDLVQSCDAAAKTNPEAAKAAALLREVLCGQVTQGGFEFPSASPKTTRWFKCTIKRFSGPALAHVLVAQEEITEIKQALRRTDHVQQQFRHLFESAPDAIIMVDHSGRIRLANHKAAQMFGYSPDELAERRVEILIESRLRRRHIDLRRHFIDSSGPKTMGDTRSTQRGRRRDGTLFPVEISLSRFSGGEDGDEYVIAAVRDVTMRLEAQADRVAREVAEAANKAKSIFLATMSHEIRTPLNAVLGLAEVMSQSALSDDQLGLLASMRESAGHLLRLIDDVLDFSKIEAGSLEIEEAPVDLSELVESTALGLADPAAARDVALHLFVAPELPARVLSDAVRLQQIIYNLLGNAIKFSSGSDSKPGRVSLRAELDRAADGPVLLLIVSDDGIGMAPEVIEKLFQPFTQGEGTTTRKFGGTGLGLAICKRIIDRIGGTVTVHSAPGQGARFAVRLPLKVLPGAGGDTTLRLAGVTCLLCESATYDRDDLRRYLEADGATVLLPATTDAGTMARAGESDSVLILGADDPMPVGAAHAMPRVLIGRDGLRRLAIRARNRRVLDSRTMLRDNLVRAVTLVLGRETVAEAAINEAEAKEIVPSFAATGGIAPILVAEDDLLNQMVIRRQLEILGLRADIAENGAVALQKWRSGPYALLLTDLHMPVMDGYALTAAIRSDEAQASGAARLPILALTANALRHEDIRARRIGMDGYLTKPVSLARLAEALRPWLPEVCTSNPPAARLLPDSVIDRSAHTDLIGSDAATIREFLTTYRQMSRDLVAQFATAVTTGAQDGAAMALHRLKSSSRWVGAYGFGDLCEALEGAARRGDQAQLVARLAEFDSLHDRVITEIEAICREMPDQP